MLRQGTLTCLLMVAVAAIGCAPRFGYLNLERLAGAPLRSPAASARLHELVPRAEELARRHGLNLVFNYASLVYAAPDLDLTPMVLGQPDGAFRVGVRGGVVDLERAFATTHEGQQLKAQLKRELEANQAEIDRSQRELRDKYGNDMDALSRSPERAALAERFNKLRIEMAAHELKATAALLARLVADVKELARTRSLDVVTETSQHDKDLDVLYQKWSRYPIGWPDLTGELIRVHDERFTGAPPKTLPELIAEKSPLDVVTHQQAQGEGELPDPPLDPAAPDSPPGSSERYEATSGRILWQCANPPNNELPKLPDKVKAALKAALPPTIKVVRYVVELYFESDGSSAGLFPQETAHQADADEFVLGTLRRWRSCPTGRRVHIRATFDYRVQ